VSKRPRRPCSHPGCPELTDDRLCSTHAKQQQRRQDQERSTAAERGYDYRWQKYRKAYLAAHPLCVECLNHDRVTAATVVDHIKPHRGDQKLFWDPKNHQSLCKPCHDSKTARTDGRWG